jgi:hypothetical protein
MIQSASLHLHKHFVGLDFRLRRFFVLQDLNAAVLVESDCMHKSPLEPTFGALSEFTVLSMAKYSDTDTPIRSRERVA